MQTDWVVDQIVHFEPGELVHGGLAHFGFHDRDGRLYAIDHGGHRLALVGSDGGFEWTVAAEQVAADVPNIPCPLAFPMYADVLPDGALVISNFGDALLYRVEPDRGSVELLVDGRELGLVEMGNCVVDDAGGIWVNEVTGCRVWRFDGAGRPTLRLGDGTAGFQVEPAAFEDVRFGWIYDLRRGPDGRIYVLDSGNFAVRAIDPARCVVETVAGTGEPGYAGDGGPARAATFGSDPRARFDGPISLSLDEDGNVFVGDRFNRVVRMLEASTGVIETIAGRPDADRRRANEPDEVDPLRVNLPEISSMDYDDGRLFVPTDLADGAGDLVVLRRR